MTMSNASWHGTDDEFRRLMAAVASHCTCTRDIESGAHATCGPHAMVADEHVLNHLVYVSRIREEFVSEEWASQELPGASEPLPRDGLVAEPSFYVRLVRGFGGQQ